MIRSRSSKKLFPRPGDDYESQTYNPRASRNRVKDVFTAIFVLVLVFLLALVLTIQGTETRQLEPDAPLVPHNIKPPLVDRKILEKLASLDDLAALPYTQHWPPRVTRIPESQPQRPLDSLSPIRFDLQFCAHSPCKFLLPLWISEQESKARIHLIELLHLAKSLNRTLVLPNAGKSRLGTCLKWDFDLYYDKKGFVDQITNRGKVLMMDKFKMWMKSRSEVPTGQLVSLNWTASTTETPYLVRKELDVYVHGDLVDLSSQFKRAFCLDSKFSRMNVTKSFAPISIVFTTHSQSSLNDGSLAQALVEELIDENILLAAYRNSSSYDPQKHNDDDDTHHEEDALENVAKPKEPTPIDSPSSPDVLIVNWDLRFPMFAVQTEPPVLNYSPRLQALTTRLTIPISPYIAIHWRMESVSPESLSSCARALVSTLHSILGNPQNRDIKHVWLATDILDGGSGTFKPGSLTLHHTKALEIVSESFISPVLSKFTLTNLRRELFGRMVANGEEIPWLSEMKEDHETLSDSGVLGILDKLVCERAAIFVSAGNGCGRAR